jgi:hypothetical protein
MPLQCDASHPPSQNLQAAALLKWRNSISTSALPSWGNSSTLCSDWIGVVCNHAGQVVELRLLNQTADAHAAPDWTSLGSITTLEILQLPVSGACVMSAMLCIACNVCLPELMP